VAYLTLDTFSPMLIARRIGIADAPAVEAMLGWVDQRLLHSDLKLGLVYDAGEDPNGRPDARARQLAADWLRARERDLRKRCAGIDFSFPSPLSRGAMIAVFWIAKPPVPYIMHGSANAAIRGSIERLGLVGKLHPREVLAELAARERDEN
jgi:hypothetical protein